MADPGQERGRAAPLHGLFPVPVRDHAKHHPQFHLITPDGRVLVCGEYEPGQPAYSRDFTGQHRTHASIYAALEELMRIFHPQFGTLRLAVGSATGGCAPDGCTISPEKTRA